MFDLVNDAEAEEGHEGEVTGRQMVDGAVARARRDFGAQPQLQGELLGELGRMYLRLEPPTPRCRCWQSRSRCSRSTRRPTMPRSTRRASSWPARCCRPAMSGRASSISLTQAREACANRRVDCAKARAYASTILSQLAADAGDEQTALAEMRRSAADIELRVRSRITKRPRSHSCASPSSRAMPGS